MSRQGKHSEGPGNPVSHLAKVAHLSEVLHVDVVTSVRKHHLRTSFRESINDIAAKEASSPKDSRRQSTYLHVPDTNEYKTLP